MKLKDHPSEVCRQWHPDNPSIEDFTHASNKKVKWICESGHEWEATVNSRTKGNGCPKCPREIKPGSSLKEKRPKLIGSWHPDNPPMETVSYGSQKKYKWVCEEDGRVWVASALNRSKGSGCPYCAGKLTIPGKTDLPTLFPELSREWNDDADIRDVPTNSSKSYKWKCSEGHVWSAVVANRTRGAGCPVCYQQSVTGIRRVRISLRERFPELDLERVSLDGDVSVNSGEKLEWCCQMGHIYVARISDRTRLDGKSTGCPRCANSGTSRAEGFIAEYIESLGFNAVRNCRQTISPKELDILIPDKNLAIEFNGLYWHTENVVGRTYHYDKWLACKKAGIQLIQIWEDNWDRQEDVVKRMVAAKLGVIRESVGARKCSVVNVDSTTARIFFNKNHIQGYTPGSIYPALINDGAPVAMAAIKKTKRPGEARLERYATSMQVLGGMSRLVKSTDFTRLITFANHEVSDGTLYEKSGWADDGEIPPEYSYLHGGRRIHKFNFRLKRFREDSSLLYEDGLTEKQLAELNGISRVYDSGKTRYVLEV